MFTLLFNDFNDLFARKTGIYKKRKKKKEKRSDTPTLSLFVTIFDFARFVLHSALGNLVGHYLTPLHARILQPKLISNTITDDSFSIHNNQAIIHVNAICSNEYRFLYICTYIVFIENLTNCCGCKPPRLNSYLDR